MSKKTNAIQSPNFYNDPLWPSRDVPLDMAVLCERFITKVTRVNYDTLMSSDNVSPKAILMYSKNMHLKVTFV